MQSIGFLKFARRGLGTVVLGLAAPGWGLALSGYRLFVAIVSNKCQKLAERQRAMTWV